MSHLPYIVAAYTLAVLIPGGFAVEALRRMRRAQRRLTALDRRQPRKPAAA